LTTLKPPTAWKTLRAGCKQYSVFNGKHYYNKAAAGIHPALIP
jgi:hypothetical protein